MPLLGHAVFGPFAGNGFTVELPGETDGEVAYVDHFLDLSTRFSRDLANLVDDQFTQWLLIFAQHLGETAYEFASSRRRNDAEYTECILCCPNDRLGLFGGCPSNR